MKQFCTNMSVLNTCEFRGADGVCSAPKDIKCDARTDISYLDTEVAELVSKQNMSIVENQKAIMKQNNELIALLSRVAQQNTK